MRKHEETFKYLQMAYNSEERIGVFSVAKIFAGDFNWIFREQPINDFGVDGFIEIATKFTSGILPTGRLIGVQIKSGTSFFTEGNDEYFVYRGSKRHLDYWSNYSLPVILILYDKVSNTAYWEEVNESTITLTKNAFKVNIPRQKQLNKDNIDALKKIGYFRNRYEYKLWQFQSSVDEIKSIIQRKKYLHVEIDSCHWTKDYHIGLAITEAETGSTPEIFYSDDSTNYYFYLPKNGSITEGIKDVLPWADLYNGDNMFSDNMLLEEVMSSFKYFFDSEFDEEISTLKEQGLICDIACLPTGQYGFRLELLPNDLAFGFLKLHEFWEQEEKVEQRLFF